MTEISTIVVAFYPKTAHFPIFNFASLKHGKAFHRNTIIKQNNAENVVQPLSIRYEQLHNSTVSKRAFPVSGANFWNSLASHVTSAPSRAIFRQRHKTFSLSPVIIRSPDLVI